MAIPASSRSFMFPKFCQRQALLFYVESEPRGTSPVPKCWEPGFYTMQIRNLSRPGFEPRTFELAYLRDNHETIQPR